MNSVQHVPSFQVRQKLTLGVNRYEVVTPDGVLAVAQQKRLALKEQVTFYADESRSRPVFGFKAGQVLDLGAGYAVTSADGETIGGFRKDFASSLLRTTFTVEAGDFTGTGTERSQLVAVLRRFTDLPFLKFHFDFVDDATGQPLLSVDRQTSVRDRYEVTVPDERVDVRLAASLTVALDALLAR